MAATKTRPKALRPVTEELADNRAVRLGSSMISGKFPTLQQAPKELADNRAVRLGSSMISGKFPPVV
jgi:hypothetical protein